MSNSDERDYAEEAYNLRMMREEGESELRDETARIATFIDEDLIEGIYGEPDNGLITVEIPRTGTFCKHQDERYVILATETYQEDVGQSAEITTFVKILRVDDNGDDMGETTKTVRWAHCTLEAPKSDIPCPCDYHTKRANVG